MLMWHLSLLLVVEHEPSKLLLTWISHLQHKHAKDFESTRQQEFFVVCNVFVVAVAELSMQILSPKYPKPIGEVSREDKTYSLIFTAGNAKKLIPIKEQMAAINFPIYDDGTLSP
jgi:hypothetical protein